MSKTKTPLFLAAWIALAAVLNCAGWLLSGLNQLNAPGYAAVILILTAVLAWWWKAGNSLRFQKFYFVRAKRRFRRFFPLAFLVVTSLAILGCVIHAPNNYDALAYRVPRVLHWLAAERWHWIPTYFNRLNTRAVAFEWFAAPFIVFTNTDRLLPVINIVCLLFAPGLFFGILTRMGVRSRVAWHWMWLLPTGYSYLLQGVGLGNDFFGAFFGLAAWFFALRARTSKSHLDVWLSVLAAALLTGSKLSNLPLLLPWLIALLPALKCLKDRIITTALIAVVSLVCSFFPMAVIDYYYCGDWTGFAAEHCPFNQKTYALHLEHNPLVLAAENLAPPVFPWAQAWNRNVIRLFSPQRLAELDKNFEPNQARVSLNELQMEEWAGLGMGLSLMLIISVLATLKYKKPRAKPESYTPKIHFDLPHWILLLSPFISIAVFMAKASLTSEARLITPYYAFFMPLLLIGRAQERIVLSKWWRALAAMVFLLAAMVVIITPARPLWPAQFILTRVNPSNPLIARALRVYQIYANRADCFALVREFLPTDVKAMGYLAIDYPETSLWRPFGSLRVEHFETTAKAEDLRRGGIKYILVNYADNYYCVPPLDEWIAQNNAELVRKIPLDLRATPLASDWRLIKLKD